VSFLLGSHGKQCSVNVEEPDTAPMGRAAPTPRWDWRFYRNLSNIFYLHGYFGSFQPRQIEDAKSP
jgi:hypothetical protein